MHFFFVAKQGLMKISDLKPNVEKMRSETKCGRPNMALHLNEQSVFWEKEKGENGEELG